MRFARRTAGLPKVTAVAMHGARRTMADVSRSLPALAQPPATASPSHPAAPPAASHQATAADLEQATPEVETRKACRPPGPQTPTQIAAYSTSRRSTTDTGTAPRPVIDE
ncbi:hypothetical protein MRX96_050089 [Rhipicephalus microplus]